MRFARQNGKHMKQMKPVCHKLRVAMAALLLVTLCLGQIPMMHTAFAEETFVVPEQKSDEDVEVGKVYWALEQAEDGSYILHFGNVEYPGGVKKGTYTINTPTNMNLPWLADRTKITTAKFDGKIKPTSLFYWFWGFTELTAVEGVGNIDTKNVSNMQNMFYQCSSLEYLDLSSFNTENVTTMKNMFSLCGKLRTLDISNFTIGNSTNCEFMLKNTYSLTELKTPKKMENTSSTAPELDRSFL